MRSLLAVLLLSSGVSMAAPTIYQEENFSFEFPTGWQKAEPPPNALALARSLDGAKGVVLMAFKIPAGESSTALEKMVSGAKNAAVKSGVAITGEQDLSINGAAFHSHSFTLPGNVATLSNMAVAGNWSYSVQGFSGTSDPSADPEIQGALHSFRLLSPVAATAMPLKTAESESDAFKVGEIAGKVAVMAFAAGVVVLMVRKLVRENKASP